MSADRLEQLQAMLAEDPSDAFLRYAIALELEHKGETRKAISALQDLLNDMPAHIPSYYQLARMLANAGNGPEAIRICEAGIEQCTSKEDHRTRMELGEMLELLRDDQA